MQNNDFENIVTGENKSVKFETDILKISDNFYTDTNNNNSNYEEEPFLKGFQILKIPAIDENGNATWPEKFSISYLENLRKRVGDNKFLSQMMLMPQGANKTRFKMSGLKFYDYDIKIETKYNTVSHTIAGEKLIAASTWWDPAFGVNGGDGSVIATVFISKDHKYFLHDIEYLTNDVYDSNKIDMTDTDTEEINMESNASAIIQCEKVADFISKNHIPSINIETNGIGKFLPELLNDTFKKRKLRAKIIPKTSTVNKDKRIINAFDAITSAGFLYVNNKIKTTPFIKEYKNWHPGSNIHDDGLDSVAGCLITEPTRLPLYKLPEIMDLNTERNINNMQMTQHRLTSTTQIFTANTTWNEI